MLVMLPASGSDAQSNYVGAERCKSCHAFEYRVWSQGPHAQAGGVLTAGQLKDAKCNTCHVTLAGDEGGALPNVQCERCHGPGKYYQPSYVMKDRELARAVGLTDVGATTCSQCHTEGAPSIRPFDYATMWARIDHGRGAREAWERGRELGSSDSAVGKVSASGQ